LTGGSGADTFVWHLADVPAAHTTTDTVADASVGDMLNLSDLISNGATLQVGGVNWDGTSPLVVTGASTTVTATIGDHIQLINVNFADGTNHTLTDTGGVVKIG
jgi:Ca2+-binding RTX toxin-like protein